MSEPTIRDAYLLLQIVDLYPNVNRTSLNKLVFFLDALAVKVSGSRLSDFEFVKMPFGPVPDGVRQAVRALKQTGLLSEAVTSEGPYLAYNYSTIQGPRLEQIRKKLADHFTPSQLDLIRFGVSRLRTLNATELSHASHEFEIWQTAEWNAKIPLERASTDVSLVRLFPELQPGPSAPQTELPF